MSSHFFAHELYIYFVHSNRRKVYKRKTYLAKRYKVKSRHLYFYEMQKDIPYLRRTYIRPYNNCKIYVTKMLTLCDLVQGTCLPNVWSGSDTSSTPEMTSWPPLRRSKQVGRDILWPQRHLATFSCNSSKRINYLLVVPSRFVSFIFFQYWLSSSKE
jgi:hypothetical protein